jgi:hypothetical protein
LVSLVLSVFVFERNIVYKWNVEIYFLLYIVYNTGKYTVYEQY